MNQIRIFGIDPGAEHFGWGLIDVSDHLIYVDSGITEVHRGNHDYQHYRMRVLKSAYNDAEEKLSKYNFDIVVSEIVPPTGGSTPNLVQRQLALTAVSAFQAVAYENGIAIHQLAANTVKKFIAGKGDASKAQVRRGVFHWFPQIQDLRTPWPADESDALAISIAFANLTFTDIIPA